MRNVDVQPPPYFPLIDHALLSGLQSPLTVLVSDDS